MCGGSAASTVSRLPRGSSPSIVRMKSAGAPVAQACGLDPVRVQRFLMGDHELDTVHADSLRAHRLGINGVHCFVIAGCHAIAGAQEPEVIERLFDVAAAEAATIQFL